MARRVTLKDLARELGLSIAAVSKGLRDHQDIAPATRRAIRAVAGRLGYRPDPALQALAEYRTQHRETSNRWTRIAVLHNWKGTDSLRHDKFYRNWWRELDAAASEKGITLEIHAVGSQCRYLRRTLDILRARGITAIFIAPAHLHRTPLRIEIPPGEFEVVTFGPSHIYPEFHCVQFDYFENFRMAWSKLMQKGFRRIGLVYSSHYDVRTGQAWRAALALEKIENGIPPGELDPLALDAATGEDRQKFLAWQHRNRCDAVITSVFDLERWCAELAGAPEVAFFNVQHPGQMGININLQQLTRSALELLWMEMQHALAGRLDQPFRLHVAGSWVDKEAHRH